jgi:Domain of unknown function (DU1801)
VADRKNQPTDAGVKAFLDAVPDPKRKADCLALVKLMRAVTGAEPVLWGASTVGFGAYTYTYPSGRTADWFTLGFSPRKKDISVYVTRSLSGFGDLLAKLGPHKCGKACLYLGSLGDVDAKVFKELLTRAAAKSNGTGG